MRDLKSLENLISDLKPNYSSLKMVKLTDAEKQFYVDFLHSKNIQGEWADLGDREEFVIDNYLCEICGLNNPVLICNFKTGL